MDDTLSEEHRLLRATIRQIVRDRVAPRAAEIDRERRYPEDVFALFRDQGLLGLLFPEEEGGSGAGTLGLALAIEEVARACATSAQVLTLTALATWPLRLAGSPSLQAAYVPAVASGRLRGAFALTEPNASSDLGAMVTRADRVGDGYLLSGEKDFISGSLQADFFIAFARTGDVPGPEGHAPSPSSGQALSPFVPTASGLRVNSAEGMTAFLVPIPRAGVLFLRRDEGMGLKGMPHGDWAFDGCAVPLDDRIGAEGQGAEIARLSMNAIQPLLAARGLGAAEECLAYGRDYALGRRIYGGRLADLQAIKLHLADIAVSVEATRLLTYQAARLVDVGRFREEADAAYLNAAKVLAAGTAVRAADNAMQVVGGHGYMEVHPLERMYRDARHLALYMGTDDVLRLRVADSVLDGGLSYGPAVSRQPTEERARREKG